MKKRFLVMLLIGTLSATMLCACGSEPAAETGEAVEESSEESGASGGSVSLDASATDVQSGNRPTTEDVEPIESEESTATEESTEETTTTESEETPSVEDAAPKEKPETIKFVIIQNTRDNMFTLTNTEKQTLTIDVETEAGYTGTMKPKSGEYEIGGQGHYVIPYSSTLTLSDMDKDIIYVSAEYPYVLSVAVQDAATVVLSEDRSVTITGKDDTSVFQYRVWMPSLGVTKESENEVMTGQGSGTLKMYWKDSKITVEQIVSPGPVDSETAETTEDDEEDSEVATVDWRTACPWADKIETGVWSDGADLSNVKQLKEGIMAAEFTPVDEITEEAKVVDLTFYDADKKKLGVLKFWQKGNHVEIDGKQFDYDTFGLE